MQRRYMHYSLACSSHADSRRWIIWIKIFIIFYYRSGCGCDVVITTASVTVLVVVPGGVTGVNVCVAPGGVNAHVAPGDKYETQTWDCFIATLVAPEVPRFGARLAHWT
jgi:hypothetical protein